MSNETMGERLPGAIERLRRWLGGDAAMRLDREFHADLLAIHCGAQSTALLRAENAAMKAQLDELHDLLDLVQAAGSIHDLDLFDEARMDTTLGKVLCGLMKRLERAEADVKMHVRILARQHDID